MFGEEVDAGSHPPPPPRASLGLASTESLDASGFNLSSTADLFLTGLPSARAE